MKHSKSGPALDHGIELSQVVSTGPRPSALWTLGACATRSSGVWGQWGAVMLGLGLAASLAGGGAPAAAADTPYTVTSDEVFPFVLPWDDALVGVTDVSSWLDRPA